MLLKALLVLIGTTGFEAAGLILWVELDARDMAGIGLIILFIGLVLERLVISGLPKNLSEWIITISTSWFEYAAWALWFTLIRSKALDPIAVFALVLLPGLHFQHALISSSKPDLNRTFSDLVQHTGFILFALIEAIGGALWLAVLTNPAIIPIPAHLILIIAITLEHIVQAFVLDRINNEGKLAQVAKAS